MWVEGTRLQSVSTSGDGDSAALVSVARFTRCVGAHEEVGHELPARGGAVGTAGGAATITATESATTARLQDMSNITRLQALRTEFRV